MYQEIKVLTEKLVRVSSVNGTPGEVAVANTIVEYLQEIPYFKENPSYIFTKKLNNDEELGRYNIFALIKGKNADKINDTVILHGHTDTVPVEDFGVLKEFAFEPDLLLEKMLEMQLEDDVRKDLESGEYMVGRGAADMKGGVAVHIVVAKHLCENIDSLKGNILLCFNPVEETTHKGMMDGLPHLLQIAKDHDLKYVLAINNDFICPMYPGDTSRYVYTGSVGKILPAFYVIGKETHVGQCFEGVNATLISSHINLLMELSPEYCDVYKGESSLPPSVLKSCDLKPSYNVQTPNRALVYANVFLHNKQLSEVTENLKQTATKAVDNTMNLINERYEKYCEITNTKYSKIEQETQVILYDELVKLAQKNYDGDINEIVISTAKELLDEKIDFRMIAVNIIEKLTIIADIRIPTVVVFYATPFCPHNTLVSEKEDERLLMLKLKTIASEFADESGENMKVMQFFPSLSDSSYLKIDDVEKSINELIENYPAMNEIYPIPFKEGREMNIPAINYGTFGKDAHKWTERVHMPYSFGVLPKFLIKTLNEFIY